MISPRVKWAAATSFLVVIAASLYAPSLIDRVLQLGRPARTEQQARREIITPPITTPTDVTGKAKLYWASASLPATLEASEIELPLSPDPVQRARQLVSALIANPPSEAQRTLPADAALLQFYLLPDGTAVADFSDALVTATPSGILSEQMVVDSLVETLRANVEPVRRLKILINGQEVETLAGHLDLTGSFAVREAAPTSAPAKAELTPSRVPGTLER